MSRALVDDVAEELHLVVRHRPHVFPAHGGELPELRKIVERSQGEWNERALERVIRGAAESLTGQAGGTEAVLALFDSGRNEAGSDHTRDLLRDLASVLVEQTPAVRIEPRDNIASLLAKLDDKPAGKAGKKIKPVTALVAVVTAVAVTVGATVLITKLGTGGEASPETVSGDAAPVKIQDVTTFRETRRNLHYVLSEAVDEPPRPAAGGQAGLQAADFDAWYGSHGGTVLRSGFTNITVQGNDSKAVRITDMKILPECADPLDGTYLIGYTQGGDQDTVKIGFNLDDPTPMPEQMTILDEGLQGTGVNYFAAKTIELAPGATEVLTVGVYTERRYCTFKLQLVLATADGPVVQEVDAQDKRFAVTGLAPSANGEAPYSGYRKMYRQDATLAWNSVDPQAPEGK
ncbi:hypothetical protein [Lentzea fradiae]|uniref:hypothetical protein n=1 Tax=Lentzea fradiae TaxID=200378 RepID=UPI001C40A750|nr:hypothetical protein [Lentzea fradiae]